MDMMSAQRFLEVGFRCATEAGDPLQHAGVQGLAQLGIIDGSRGVCCNQVLCPANRREEALHLRRAIGRELADKWLGIAQGKDTAVEEIGRHRFRPGDAMRAVVRIGRHPLGIGTGIPIA